MDPELLTPTTWRSQDPSATESRAPAHEDRQTTAVGPSEGPAFDLLTVVNAHFAESRFQLAWRQIGEAARAATLGTRLYLTVDEAAEYSGLPAGTIRALIERNELPAVELEDWVIKRKHLDALELRHLRRL